METGQPTVQELQQRCDHTPIKVVVCRDHPTKGRVCRRELRCSRCEYVLRREEEFKVS